MIQTHFYRLYSIMIDSKSIAGSKTKVCSRCQCFAANLLSYWIWYVISYLHNFVKEMVASLGAMID